MGTIPLLLSPPFLSVISSPLGQFPHSVDLHSKFKLSLYFNNFVVDIIFNIYPCPSFQGWRLFGNTHKAVLLCWNLFQCDELGKASFDCIPFLLSPGSLTLCLSFYIWRIYKTKTKMSLLEVELSLN